MVRDILLQNLERSVGGLQGNETQASSIREKTAYTSSSSISDCGAVSLSLAFLFCSEYTADDGSSVKPHNLVKIKDKADRAIGAVMIFAIPKFFVVVLVLCSESSLN